MKLNLNALIFFIGLLTLSVGTAQAQKIEPIPVKTFYKQRVERNIKFLCKEKECLDNFLINDRGIYVYPTNQKVSLPEFTLYWREMPYFNELLETKDHPELIDLLQRKGNHYFYGIKDTHVDPAKYPVSQWTGLRIAIDPGHIASDWEQALLEKRYVKVEGGLYNQRNDITFFEANLAYVTALQLKQMLEDKGAIVTLTHEYGKSAFDMTYDEWKENNLKEDVVAAYKKDWIDREKLDYLLTDTDQSHKDYMLFHDVFRNMDFVKRAERINEFDPHLTLVIHYNASENNPRYGDNYLKPVNENWSMVFIPGAFLGFEVDGKDQIDQRFELLRLLVSRDLEESNVFATDIIKALDDQLKVDALPEDNNFVFTEDFAIQSDRSIGVYHRNFALTRVVKGPIAYAETLYQDNEDEIPLLGKKDITVEGIRSSSRTRDVAKVYFSAIENWLNYNKEYAKVLDALYEDQYGDEEFFEDDIAAQKSENE